MLPPPPPPPPPPSEPMLPLLPPPSRRELKPTHSNQIVITKQQQQQPPMMNQQNFAPARKPRDDPMILPRGRRTNPLIWCAAIGCLIFSLLLIFFGIATLIIFLVIKPRTPVFDTPSASLNVIYFDSPEYFNGDFTFLANFSNPNRKLNVRFEYLDLELYFADSLIATQALQPFSERQGETRLVSIHMISSLVYLPPNLGLHLQRQVQSNRINYNIRATFRVKLTVGLIHFSYWLHSRCQLEMTSPPIGMLIARNCKTKR